MGMRIALCSPWMVRCGIYTYSRNLAEAIADLGHEVYIVRLPRFGIKTPDLVRLVAEKFPRDADLFVISHEYGLFHGFEGDFYGELKKLYPDKPLITIMHSVGNFMVDRVVAEVSRAVIVHNKFCFKRFGYPKKTVIIPHGAKPVKCPPREESKKSLGIDPRIPIVGYCGFISTYKGLETLIEAMTKIPQAALLIGGGWHAGPDTTYITNLKQTSLSLLPGRCQWLGYVPDEKLATVYGAMDVVVYPSRFATESGALIMALSHGKAVIASNVPPFKEKEKVGALMTFKSVNDLRRKIRKLLKDKSLREKYEKNAWEYAMKTSWKEVAKKHIKLYEEVLS